MKPDHGLFRELSEQGFSLVRLHGKNPAGAEGEGWQKWCERWRHYDEIGFEPHHNAGIACGPASGLLVVDVDGDSFEELCRERSWYLPPTRTHQTGTGKYHYLYKYPKNGKRYTCRRFPGKCDLLGIGGQIVAPGSIHPNGKPYIILEDVFIAPPPQWLLYEMQKREYKPRPLGNPRTWNGNIDALPVSPETRQLIREGRPVGYRSEAIMTVLNALAGAELSDQDIFAIFDSYPIGEKYKERGQSRFCWLQPQISKARSFVGQGNWGNGRKLRVTVS